MISPALPAAPLQLHTLANGLRVGLQPDPQVPLVAVALQYGVGSRDERPGASGMAHLFEHLMFQGTPRVGPSELMQKVLDVGGSANASTSSSATRYHTTLPAHQLQLGLWLEADRMERLAVTEASFRTQLAAVIEERRQRVDDAPYGRAMERLESVSFSRWAQAHPVIGSMDDLVAADLARVLGFHSDWYRPNNAALVVVGDFAPGPTLATIEDWFGGIAPGPTPDRPALDEPPRTAPVHLEARDPLARLPAVFRNHRAPAITDPLAPAMEVLEAVLFRGAASRLQKALVIDAHHAIQLSGGFDGRTAPGLFSIGAAIPQDGDPQAIFDAFDTELERLAATPLTDDELLRSRQPLLAGHLFALESPLSRALGFADGLVQQDDPHWRTGYLGRVRDVGPAAIQEAARAVLAAPPVTLVVRPEARP